MKYHISSVLWKYTITFMLTLIPSSIHQLLSSFFFLIFPPPPCSTLFPYTTLFRSSLDEIEILILRLEVDGDAVAVRAGARKLALVRHLDHRRPVDRKSTRLNSSHLGISYAVFCLKKKIK